MRFEELSYRVDGLPPVKASFHPRLSVVGSLGARPRSGWIERALGVLGGTRPGDSVSLAFVDHAGRRVKLERDHHGAARITGVGTGEDFTPDAGDLPLDGRFDWFASVGLDGRSARTLLRVDPAQFKGDAVDPFEAEDELFDLRSRLAQAEAEYEVALARFRQAGELYRRVGQIDEQLGRLEEEQTRRRHGETLAVVRRLEVETTGRRETVAAELATAGAILAAADAGARWQRAADALEIARLVIGDRPLLEPEASDESASEPMPPEDERLAGDDDPHELELAHQAVEDAERDLDRARVPGLALSAKLRLARAQRREQAILRAMGLASWLTFQMQRLEFTPASGLDPDGEAAGRPPVVDPAVLEAERARDARLRQTLNEAESNFGEAQAHFEAVMADTGLLPPGNDPEALAAHVEALTHRAVEAAVHRRHPPTGPALREVEEKLAEAQAALAAYNRPDWNEPSEVGDLPLPDPAPLFEERARLYEEAYRLELALPDVAPMETRRDALRHEIGQLESAARAGFRLRSLEEVEMLLLDRFVDARRVGPEAEPVPLLVDDAFAGFDEDDRVYLLHLLARLSEMTQVVYVTGDPVTLRWAKAEAQTGDVVVIAPTPPAGIASVA
ncbi:MAG: hypothetical protein ACRDZ7_02930 [Acidimicrobiia bacterium]